MSVSLCSDREVSLQGCQLLNGTADFLCSFFKFFLLTVGFLCLEIKNTHVKLKLYACSDRDAQLCGVNILIHINCLFFFLFRPHHATRDQTLAPRPNHETAREFPSNASHLSCLMITVTEDTDRRLRSYRTILPAPHTRASSPLHVP